ncbi:hypothetical protein FHU38_005443 [Saccharomonospora amisosensis]|uniref:Uncharacterized protein n=1 Tax=Saccharomonospora amisosensis TaxID=1128677 RepID=A0A7X5UVS4_9PSEU|nr:hypothetical protein [Saccharomonospora amisosensis]NIJ15035.1 hypothetical protein [Saccharomonospora amisosensis]
MLALWPLPALLDASTKLDDARATLGSIAYGTTDADLLAALEGLGAARADLRSCSDR